MRRGDEPAGVLARVGLGVGVEVGTPNKGIQATTLLSTTTSQHLALHPPQLMPEPLASPFYVFMKYWNEANTYEPHNSKQ